MSSRQPDELSLEELEALLQRQRQRITANKVQRFVAAEEAPEAPAAGKADTDERPPRSPETWRGAGGHDRYFHSAGFSPLIAAAVSARPRRLRDWLLLALEIIAFAGLILIVWQSYVRLSGLNREYRAAQQARLTRAPAVVATDAPVILVPTATPAVLSVTEDAATPVPSPSAAWNSAPSTPTVAVELPGVRPTAAGNNPLVRRPEEPATSAPTAGPTPTPGPPTATPAPGTPIRIVIPAIDVDAPVVEGDDWESLKQGVGHRRGSALPGESHNLVLSAHNDVYGEIFRDLNKLQVGDEVRVYTPEAEFVYRIDSVEIVLPSRVDLIEPGETPILTLVTCYPYLLDTHRVVVRASLLQPLTATP